VRDAFLVIGEARWSSSSTVQNNTRSLREDTPLNLRQFAVHCVAACRPTLRNSFSFGNSHDRKTWQQQQRQRVTTTHLQCRREGCYCDDLARLRVTVDLCYCTCIINTYILQHIYKVHPYMSTVYYIVYITTLRRRAHVVGRQRQQTRYSDPCVYDTYWYSTVL
jgi:hypothetical protein